LARIWNSGDTVPRITGVGVLCDLESRTFRIGPGIKESN